MTSWASMLISYVKTFPIDLDTYYLLRPFIYSLQCEILRYLWFMLDFLSFLARVVVIFILYLLFNVALAL